MWAGRIRSQEAHPIRIAEITSVGIGDDSGRQRFLARGGRCPSPQIGTGESASAWVDEPYRASTDKHADPICMTVVRVKEHCQVRGAAVLDRAHHACRVCNPDPVGRRCQLRAAEVRPSSGRRCDAGPRRVKSSKVATAGINPLAWLRSLLVIDAYAGHIDRTAAVSPDSTWLYSIRDFGGPGGVSLVHLPDLVVKGRWLPDVSLNSVWVSADGRTIYLLENGDQLRILRTDGSQIAKLALPPNVDSFIVPTIP